MLPTDTHLGIYRAVESRVMSRRCRDTSDVAHNVISGGGGGIGRDAGRQQDQDIRILATVDNKSIVTASPSCRASQCVSQQRFEPSLLQRVQLTTAYEATLSASSWIGIKDGNEGKHPSYD